MYETVDDAALECLKAYTVTKEGEVISPRTGKPMAKTLNENGYYKVTLTYQGGYRRFLLHRLVALGFFGPSNGLAVNHKDGDRLNNHIDNLEYVTLQDNLKHYWQAGKFHDRIKMTAEKARQAREEYHNTKIKVHELATKYGVSKLYMSDILENTHWVDPTYTRTRVFRRPWQAKANKV